MHLIWEVQSVGCSRNTHSPAAALPFSPGEGKDAAVTTSEQQGPRTPSKLTDTQQGTRQRTGSAPAPLRLQLACVVLRGQTPNTCTLIWLHMHGNSIISLHKTLWVFSFNKPNCAPNPESWEPSFPQWLLQLGDKADTAHQMQGRCHVLARGRQPGFVLLNKLSLLIRQRAFPRAERRE